MIEPIFPYLLKASGILFMFFLVYNLFLSRETFYQYNRHFLLSGILASFLLPLFPIPKYIEVLTASEPISIDIIGISASAASISPAFTWESILIVTYLAGVVYCLGVLGMQIASLYRIYKSGKKVRVGDFTYVQLDESKSPFSFFKMIFYSKNTASDSDFEAMMAHEQAHCKQWHTADILLSRMAACFLWFNPFAWYYRQSIVQNLEFLADDAARNVQSTKSYQYALLRASGLYPAPALANTFYNSLIKKRIVMLQQSRSKRSNLLKLGLILPALALFLWSFNTVDVYVPSADEPLATTLSDGKKIEITIDSKTTNAELKDIKKDLKEKGIDFSYTAVRNDDGEIIDLEIQISSKEEGKSMNGSSSFNNDGKPIDPVRIMINSDHGTMLFMGKDDGHKMSMIHEDMDESVWVHEGDGEHKRIEVIKMGDGDDQTVKIIVDGEEVSEEEYEKMKGDDKVIKKTIKINKSKGKGKNVFIMKDSDDEHDIEVIEDDGSGFMFIDMDGDGEEPMYLIDGKKASREDVKNLGTKNIATVKGLKGDAAEKKYGKDAKHGVVEIITKEKD